MSDWPFVRLYLLLLVVGFLRGGATFLLARGGRGLVDRRRTRNPAWLAHGEALVRRFGAPAVSLSFLTVGLQTAVLVAAGALRMPPRRFVPALFVGAAAWAAVYSTLGIAVLEAFWGDGRVWIGVAAMATVVVLVWAVNRFLERRVSS